MDRKEYWLEVLSVLCEESGVVLTPEQMLDIANGIARAHEHIGQAFYEPCGPRDFVDRPQSIRLRNCPDCSGVGLTPVGASHYGTCTSCSGKGEVRAV